MTSIGQLGKYKILEEIGTGGFATVYKAQDPNLNRIIALKVLHSFWSNDSDFVLRFKQEAQTVARLDHPHIVTIYETGEADGQLYIAMTYLTGRTLRDLLANEAPLSLDYALPILSQIAAALDYSHAQGVVHRDIKPANMMVKDIDQKVQLTLLDFGLVKAMEGSVLLTSQGALLGSPEYMAPEQADPNRVAEIGPATDRYALGVVAYHMLTGRVPFPGNTPGTLNAHENKPVPPPRSFRSDLPEPVAQILLKMLAKNPNDRYPSASAFVEELNQAFLTESEIRQRQVKIEPLYRQLQAAVEVGNWTTVLELGAQIQTLAPNYENVADLMVYARKQLQQPSQPLGFRKWIWGVIGFGGVFLLGLLCLGLLNFGGGVLPGFMPMPTDTIEWSPTPTETSTTEPTFTPTQTPLPPTSTPTETPVMPTTTPTVTPTFEGLKPIIYNFIADRYTITIGDSATLSWKMDNAQAAFLRYGDVEESVVSPGSKTVSPTHDATYTLIARNLFGETTAELTVKVNNAASIPTDTPPPAMKYAAPVLLAPPEREIFVEGAQIKLRWGSVGELAPDEQYAVHLIYQASGQTIRQGTNTRGTEWVVPPSLYGGQAVKLYLYAWYVVVERLNDDGSGTAISPESEHRTFIWK